jgi:AcrR family transcriptional regulator
MTKKSKPASDISTEEKIKDAARRVFLKKGYASTRTRDIAEEAGLNLALLNYYFRSKEKLFELVMTEKLLKFFGIIFPVVNDQDTSLERKIELIAHNYIDMILDNPDLPIFVLSEIRHKPERFASTMQLKKILTESHFVKQLHIARPDINPLQVITTLLGITVFPFLMKPVLFASGSMNQKAFDAFMEERRALIVKWVNTMLTTR